MSRYETAKKDYAAETTRIKALIKAEADGTKPTEAAMETEADTAATMAAEPAEPAEQSETAEVSVSMTTDA